MSANFPALINNGPQNNVLFLGGVIFLVNYVCIVVY